VPLEAENWSAAGANGQPQRGIQLLVNVCGPCLCEQGGEVRPRKIVLDDAMAMMVQNGALLKIVVKEH
jgi:hypothetical protein